MSRGGGVIIPKVKDFDDALTTEYYEQGAKKAYTDSQSMIGDLEVLSKIDSQYQNGQANQGGNSPCSSAPRERTRPEYKVLLVFAGIIGAFVFVSWNHHTRMHH